MSQLSNQEAANGWNQEIAIDFSDFSVAKAGVLADNATKTFTYTLPAGSQVRHAAVRLDEAFDDSGAGDELNVTVGDGVDPDGYITTAALHTDQTEITYVANTGALLDNENGKVYTVADTVDILFTPNVSTGTDYSLNELTSGKVVVKLFVAQI